MGRLVPNPPRRRRSSSSAFFRIAWRSQSARDSPVPAIRKTAENDDDDEDEKDGETALFCQGSDGLECLFDTGGPW